MRAYKVEAAILGAVCLIMLIGMAILNGRTPALIRLKNSSEMKGIERSQVRTRIDRLSIPVEGGTSSGDRRTTSSNQRLVRSRAETSQTATATNDKTTSMLEELLALKQQDGRNNALIHYMLASQKMPRLPTNEEGELIHLVLREGWDERALPLLPYLVACADAFAEVQKGLEVDYARGVGFKGYETPVPEFIRLQSLTKLMAVYGRYLESQNETAKGAQQYIAALKMGHDFSSEDNVMMGHLMGIAIESIALRQFARVSQSGQLPNAQLSAFAAQLEKLQATHGTIERSYRDEVVNSLMILEQLRDNPDEYRKMTALNSDEKIEEEIQWVLNHFPEATAQAQYATAVLSQYFKTPIWQRTPEMETQRESLLESMNTETGLKVLVQKAPELETRYLATMSRYNQARLHAALETYRQTSGGPPSELGELKDKGLLNELPLDPFTGQEYQYVRQNDGTYELFGTGPSRQAGNQGVTYDPTNGITSPGNLSM